MEFLLAMQMLAVPFEQNPAEHAAHQEMKANLLFEVPQEQGGQPVKITRKGCPFWQPFWCFFR